MIARALVWMQPAPALRLATLRVLVVGFAWVYVCLRLPALLTLHALPRGQFHPVGILGGLAGPPPAWVVALAVIATLVSGLAFGLGARARVSGPVFAILLLGVLGYRNSWGMVFHTENLLVLHVIVLACSRSCDALALDARGRADPGESPRYGWPIRLMNALTVLTYAVAGVAKLRHAGVAWVTSDALLTFVAYDNMRKAELGDPHAWLGGWFARDPVWVAPFAAIALSVELGAPLALVHPRLGRAWALLAWSFHVGVVAMMFIVFPYPLSGVAYAGFFRVEVLARAVGRRFGRLRSGRPWSGGQPAPKPSSPEPRDGAR